MHARPTMMVAVAAIGVALVVGACSASGDGSARTCATRADCASDEVCRDGRCVAEGALDGATIDASRADGAPVPPPVPPPPDAGPACSTPCAAGEACVEGACVADCRLAGARSCGEVLVCAETTGRCVMPGEDCTPTGALVDCGSAEFHPRCGPGTECAMGRCIAAAGCTGVACDVAGICRGIGCPGGGGTGAGRVSGLVLEPVADVTRGAMAAVRVRGRVEGMDLCAITVTIELRIETAIFVSAFNDATLWEVDLATGAREAFATGITGVNGLATDALGGLYVLQDCTVGRVDGVAGARAFVPIATLASSGCSRLATGPDGALYVSASLDVHRVEPFDGTSTLHGSIPAGIAAWGSTFLTGLAVADDGAVIAGEHWRELRRIPAGGGPGEAWAAAPPFGLVESDNPWNEGMAFDAEGSLHVGVFPSNPMAGFVYRVEPDRSTTVLVDLAAMTAAVPTTQWAGIHGIAFGLDGALYFTNQNTQSSTFEPFGQLLVRTTDGTLRALAEGFNFDWPRGYDGDLVVGTRAIATVTVAVASDGTFETTFDAPDIDGAFEVRATVIDPTSGVARSARRAARAR